MAVRVTCMSDVHGALPALGDIPGSDLLVLAGDIAPDGVDQHRWLAEDLAPWLEAVQRERAHRVVAVAGNHDACFAEEPEQARALPWTYLEDEPTSAFGLQIWGTPWSLGDPDWPFTVGEERELARRLDEIPTTVDVLVSHGPPAGVLDISAIDGAHRGSRALLDTIERVAPRLVVVGHTHPGRGVFEADGLTVVNASSIDGDGAPLEPIVVEVSPSAEARARCPPGPARRRR